MVTHLTSADTQLYADHHVFPEGFYCFPEQGSEGGTGASPVPEGTRPRPGAVVQIIYLVSGYLVKTRSHDLRSKSKMTLVNPIQQGDNTNELLLKPKKNFT